VILVILTINERGIMKKIFLIGLFLCLALRVNAQCVGEIKNVVQDEARGSIIVETEYTLNGKVVQLGKIRYLETSGTNAEIIAQAKEDVKIHAENLIRRIPKNQEFYQDERLKRQKELTTPIIASIKDSLVGHKETKTESKYTFKEKEIKVTYDEKNTVTSVIAVTK